MHIQQLTNNGLRSLLISRLSVRSRQGSPKYKGLSQLKVKSFFFFCYPIATREEYFQ